MVRFNGLIMRYKNEDMFYMVSFPILSDEKIPRGCAEIDQSLGVENIMISADHKTTI